MTGGIVGLHSESSQAVHLLEGILYRGKDLTREPDCPLSSLDYATY